MLSLIGLREYLTIRFFHIVFQVVSWPSQLRKWTIMRHGAPRSWTAGSKSSGLATNSIFSDSFFVKKTLICLNNDLRRGNSILCRSSQQLQCLPLGPLKGAVSAQKAPLFELTHQRPSGALDSSRVLLPELQRYKDTIRCYVLGV